MDLPLERGGTRAFLQQLFTEHLLATIKLCAGAGHLGDKGHALTAETGKYQAEDGHLGG